MGAIERDETGVVPERNMDAGDPAFEAARADRIMQNLLRVRVGETCDGEMDLFAHARYQPREGVESDHQLGERLSNGDFSGIGGRTRYLVIARGDVRGTFATPREAIAASRALNERTEASRG